MQLSEGEKRICLQLARDAIEEGLQTGKAMRVNPEDYSEPLNETACCFVTLTKRGDLRGCIGALEPYQSLIEDVAEHAYAAAFRDPRFPTLNARELSEVQIEISVLTPQTEMTFESETDLLNQLRPEIDGLTIMVGAKKSTFLPAVWEKLPDKSSFLIQLKRKAGLPDEFWSSDLRAYTYQSLKFSE